MSEITINNENLGDFLTEYIYTKDTDELLSGIDIKSTTKFGDSCMFLLPNGLLLTPESFNATDAQTHSIMADYIVWKWASKLGFNPDYDEYHQEMDIFLDNLSRDYKWIRLNAGKGPVDGRTYIVIGEEKPNVKQQETLEEFFEYLYINKLSKDVLVFVDYGNESMTYSFEEYNPNDVVNKICNYYTTGNLAESLNDYEVHTINDTVTDKHGNVWNILEMTAGYILDDGKIIIMDEYHGEDESLRDKGYPEFSNTHPEEDTCIRLYSFKEPSSAQWDTIEKIIDYYFDSWGYCKIEIWDKKPVLYINYNYNTGEYTDEINNIFKDGCNFDAYDLVKILKNYYSNKIDIS